MSNRYSTIFDSKLPAFIKDDPSYSRFIEFFDAYYQWFDDTYDIYGFGDKLDIDSGFQEFYAYYAADFLPYFPNVDTIAADKIKLLKIIKELYKSKGIPDSFKFLFRALYNTNVEVYATSDFILKPSDGKWIVPKSIKIKSIDPAFLNINNFKIFGETSKSIGVVEKSKINGKFTQIYLSNIERVFSSAETIRVLDNNNKDVYFLNGKYVKYDISPPEGAVTLTSKIIGSLSNITITPTRRGKYYKVGDPVVLTNGFSPITENPIGASAIVSEVTSGQIQKVVITKSGYGFRTYPNSEIQVIKSDGNVDTNALCIISLVDDSRPANVGYVTNDCIEDNYTITLGANNFNFSRTANANTQLKNCFSYLAYTTYPITAVTVRNGGGGYESPPLLEFHSSFNANTLNAYRQDIDDLGILAPIDIINGGRDYTTNDTINILGGDGNFAYARIKSVNANGSITAVEYYYNTNNPYSIGGMGYKNANLPTVNVASATGSNSILTIPAILGTGVEYTLETDRIGAITKISLIDNGEDYVSTPNVSLRVQDIVITGTAVESINPDTCIVYQGNLETPSFYGKIGSVSSIYFNPETSEQVFSIRVYDYRGAISGVTSCNVYNTTTESTVSVIQLQSDYTTTTYKNGIKIFGDGSAKATAKFLDGLIFDEGRYLNTDGQPSAHSVLQSDVYNYFTYILTAEKDYDSYKDIIKNLLHPIGTQLITRNLLKSESSFNISSNSVVYTGIPILGISTLVKQNDNTAINFSNTINIYANVDIDTLFTVNSNISIIGDTNCSIYSTINNIDTDNNRIQLNDSIQYKFPNIYSGYTVSNSIIITSNNNYSDTKYSMNTFIGIGDSITIGNNSPIEINAISGNRLYFTTTLNPSGNVSHTANVTIIKDLSSNKITKYITV
jgi:hypothetical protein